MARNALQQPAIKRELELKSKEQSASIAQYGGFQGLKTKLEQGQLGSTEVTALLRHMQVKAQDDRTQGRSQSR